MKDVLRLAVWECEPLPLDVAGNLRRINAQALLARAAGADLLVTPEMVLTGYDIGADAARRLAEPADGPSAQAVSDAARRHGIAVAYGYPELADDGSVYNAAQLIDAAGRPVGHHRKTHLFGTLDRVMFRAGRGDEPAFALHGWSLGLAICYDIEFPETARRLARAGADLIVVPTANMVGFEAVQRVLLPARALENQLFVAYANYVGREGSLTYSVESGVWAPDALPLGCDRQGELLLADLDRERLAASRKRYTYRADWRPGISSRT